MALFVRRASQNIALGNSEFLFTIPLQIQLVDEEEDVNEKSR